MKFSYKFFKLPGPKDLGMSESNHYMKMRNWSNPEHLTWEDYDERLAKDYPVRYFFAEQVPSFLKYKIWYPVWRPLNKAHYWLVSHLHPKRRYHMLDLRQPKGEYDQYRYGWNDVPEKMVYAMFNLLKDYFNEEPADLSQHFSSEEIEADPILKTQHENYLEAKALLHWWQVERKEDWGKVDQLWEQYNKLHPIKNYDDLKAAQSREAWIKAEENMELKLEEMLVRLLKIRNSLWT